MRRSRSVGILIVIAVLGVISVTIVLAQSASAPQSVPVPFDPGFTYQGQLKRNGTPITSLCDFKFGLWNDNGNVPGANQIGVTETIGSISVTNGLFTVVLNDQGIAFGDNAFNGDARYLAIQVKCGGDSTFTALTGDLNKFQPLSPAPYALAVRGLRVDMNNTSPNLIGGYRGNVITTAIGSVIGGGGNSSFINRISDSDSAIVGGSGNTISNSDSFIGGGFGNTIGDAAHEGTIGGGGNNSVNGDHGAIFAGINNRVAADDAFIGGGTNNILSGNNSVIGGGYSNTITSVESIIAGGGSNVIAGDYAVIGGGIYNKVLGESSSIGGGNANLASGGGATVSGGTANDAVSNTASIGGGYGNTASELATTIGGGFLNKAGGNSATVGGGSSNQASGNNSTVPGGSGNTAQGINSFAAGLNAKALNDGSFVWADDSTSAPISSTANNQFIIRANGFVGINDNHPTADLTISSSKSISTSFTGIDIYNSSSSAGLTGWRMQVVGSDTPARTGNFEIYYTSPFLIIQPGGNVGVGTATPNAKLEVNGIIRVDSLGSAGSTSLCWNASSQIATCSSSLRYKNNVDNLTLGLDAISHLRPVTFNWKDSGQADLGFVAEEVNRVTPLLTTLNQDGQIEGVKYDRITAVLVKGMQEQQQQIADLKAQNAQLEARLSSMEQNASPTPFSAFNLISVLALIAVAAMWLQQRKRTLR